MVWTHRCPIRVANLRWSGATQLPMYILPSRTLTSLCQNSETCEIKALRGRNKQTCRQTDRQTDNDKVAQDLTNHIFHISKPEEVSFSPILKTIGDQKEKIPLNWWQHVSQWHNFNDVNQQIQKVQFNGWSRKETKGKMWFLHMCTRGSFASLKS